MRRRARLLIGISFAIMASVVATAPFALMLLPNPKPVAVADIAAQMPGSYLITGGHSYHLFPSPEPRSDVPSDALVAEPDAVFVVKYRQLSALSSYTLWSLGGASEIAVERDVSTPKQLRLIPRRPLGAGDYYAIVPKESLYGGEDYVYFTVAEKSGAAGYGTDAAGAASGAP